MGLGNLSNLWKTFLIMHPLLGAYFVIVITSSIYTNCTRTCRFLRIKICYEGINSSYITPMLSFIYSVCLKEVFLWLNINTVPFALIPCRWAG